MSKSALDAICGVRLNNGQSLEQVLSADECQRILDAAASYEGYLRATLEAIANDPDTNIETQVFAKNALASFPAKATNSPAGA